MPKFIISFLLILFLFFQLELNGQIIINEVMAKNSTILSDFEGDYPDWIELYNPNDQAVDLNEWHISDVNNINSGWTFPNVSIGPLSYLIVFASDKNIVSQQEMHTDFKLSSDGETVYLYNAQEQLVSDLNYPSIDQDQSFGNFKQGQQAIFDYPTPGGSNELSSNLTCEMTSGFYDFPLSIQFSDNISNGEYKFALESKELNIDDQTFTSEIVLERDLPPNYYCNLRTSPEQSLIPYKAWEAPDNIIPKCKIVKYAAFNNDDQISLNQSRSFFDKQQFDTQLDYPIISIISNETDLFDHEKGIYTPGANFELSNPEWTGNYYQKGEEWEREVKFEFFDKDKNLLISQDVGLRVHGGLTRCASQKSLRIHARETYGEKYLKAKLFENSEIDRFKNIVLRTSMASWRNDLIFKDALIHKLSDGLNVDHQLQRPVLVYLNGEYWGIHYMSERVNEHYISNNHDLEVDSIELFDWTNPSFFELLNFVKENDLSLSQNYEKVQRQLDVPSFIDYLWTQVYFGNVDWPHNNFTAWRPKSKDGKWRFILYDTDAGFYEPEISNLNHLALIDGPQLDYDPFISVIFLALINNASFVDDFIDRYSFLIHNDFSPSNVIENIRSMQDELEPGLLNHMSRWNYPESRSSWENNIQSDLLSFASLRPCLVQDQLSTFFERENLHFECNDQEIEEPNFAISPNPGSGQITVKFDNFYSEVIQLSVFNSLGQLVVEKKDLIGTYDIKVDLSEFQNGTYFLVFYNESINQTLKFVLID